MVDKIKARKRTALIVFMMGITIFSLCLFFAESIDTNVQEPYGFLIALISGQMIVLSSIYLLKHSQTCRKIFMAFLEMI